MYVPPGNEELHGARAHHKASAARNAMYVAVFDCVIVRTQNKQIDIACGSLVYYM
jgi:hypothetical protein